MKYFIFLLLLVQLLCCGHHGRGHHHHHPPPPSNDQNVQLLQQKIDQLERNTLQLTENYNSKLIQLQQQIESLQFENSNIYHLLEQQKKHNNDQQVFLQLQVKPVYQIELWSQRTSEYDSQYFILIYLENEIVVKLTCKIDRCDQEKKHLTTAILDGVSAEKIEIGQLSKSISLQKSLDLYYSQRIHNMSNQEQVKQLFRSLKERNFDL